MQMEKNKAFAYKIYSHFTQQCWFLGALPPDFFLNERFELEFANLAAQ